MEIIIDYRQADQGIQRADSLTICLQREPGAAPSSSKRAKSQHADGKRGIAATECSTVLDCGHANLFLDLHRRITQDKPTWVQFKFYDISSWTWVAGMHTQGMDVGRREGQNTQHIAGTRMDG